MWIAIKFLPELWIDQLIWIAFEICNGFYQTVKNIANDGKEVWKWTKNKKFNSFRWVMTQWNM